MNGVAAQSTKRKRITFVSVLCALFLFLFALFPVREATAQAEQCNACHATYENGFCVCEGTAAYQPAAKMADKQSAYDGYYAISNAGQLYWFSNKVKTDNGAYAAANAVLTCNITVNKGDVSGCDGVNGDGWRDWLPIGVSSTKAYKGVFDGNGFSVCGLYLQNASYDYVGLVGYLSGGALKNVSIINGYLHGHDYVGGVVGFQRGAVEGCANLGAMVRGRFYVGGIAGYNNGGNLAYCYNVAAVSGDLCVGGVVGGNQHNGTKQGVVRGCYHFGTLSKTEEAQGVVGRNQGDAIDCFYLAQTETDDGGKTAAQFASGEIAYLLDGQAAEGQTRRWGQTLQGDGWQSTPVLGGKTVYYGYRSCIDEQKTYSNEALFFDRESAHMFADTWAANDTHHYYECTASGCMQKSGEMPHVYADEWKWDENGHWRACICGHKTDYAAHTYGEWTETKRATKQVEGERQSACPCGNVRSESTPKLPRRGLSKGMIFGIVGGGAALLGVGIGTVLLIKKKKGK